MIILSLPFLVAPVSMAASRESRRSVESLVEVRTSVTAPGLSAASSSSRIARLLITDERDVAQYVEPYLGAHEVVDLEETGPDAAT